MVLACGAAQAADVTDASAALRESDTQAVIAMIQQGFAKAQADDFKGAAAQLDSTIASPDFVAAPDALKRAAYLILAAARLQLGERKAAHDAAIKATGFADAAGEDWGLRFLSADDADKTEVLTSLAKVAEHWPDQLANVNSHYVNQILSETRNEPALKDLRLRAIDALNSDGWPKDALPGDFDFKRIDLIEAYLDRGEVAKAAAVVKQIKSPYALARLRMNKRDDPVREGAGDQLQIAAADTAFVGALRDYAAAHPAKLKAVAALTRAMIHDGKPGEALVLIDQALAKASAAPKPEEAFADYADQINWLYDNRSDALILLGRVDEGLAAMAKGAGLKEHGNVNVSQTINLGGTYDAFGRPKDALKAVEAVSASNVSPYGLMQAEEVRACAYAQLGDAARYQAKLDYLREHMKDAPASLQRVLLCANDLDGAAKVVVQRLQDPSFRDSALADLQDFARPATDPPFQAETHRRLLKVRDRPDVRAAIDAFGRIESFPIYPEDY